MSSKKQRRPGPRFTQQQIDFVVNAEGKSKQIADAFNATFDREITHRGVRTLKQKHGPYRGNHKWTREQMTFALNADGTNDEVAAAYKAKFNAEIDAHSVKHLRTRYGPGQPLPDTDTGRWTRDQVQFVLDESEKPEYDHIADRAKFEKIAENYDTQFDPTPKMNARGIRTIRERYGPGHPLPCGYTNDQLQFILEAKGTSGEVAKAYNVRFNPKTKMSAAAAKNLKEQHGCGLPSP